MKKSKNNPIVEKSEAGGFFRIQITEDGKGVVGDSGWKKNQLTNAGVNVYLSQWLCAGASGQYVQFMALGTGTVPASNATSQDGEITHRADSRKSVSTSIVSSRTAQFTASFGSAASFVTTTVTLQNIGLWNSSLATNSATTGTLFAGNTYTTSSCATNQNVNVTYQIRFP